MIAFGILALSGLHCGGAGGTGEGSGGAPTTSGNGGNGGAPATNATSTGTLTTATSSAAGTTSSSTTTGSTSASSSTSSSATSTSTSSTSASSSTSSSSSSGGQTTGVHAVGNQLYDGSTPIRLLGVNRSGTEYKCTSGANFFEGPNDQASITAILSWKANAVRVPLNEDCWLGINGLPKGATAASYQTAIKDYVSLLLKNNIYPILDLHWAAPGTTAATMQLAMPDLDHAVDFWTQVAMAFASQPKVILELFNEPFPDNNMDAPTAWTCWRDGGTCPGITYQAAGMQTLLNAVRNAGADNFVLLGGLQYSNDLRSWLMYEPTDSAKNHGAAWHIYNDNPCATTTCFNQQAGPVAAKVPILATEINHKTVCDGAFITTVMSWLDNPGTGIPAQSYLAWAWDTNSNPSIVSDYNGTAKCNGTTYKAHLASTPH